MPVSKNRRKKNKSGRARKKGSASPPTRPREPDPRTAEAEEPLSLAQELMCEAWDTPDKRARIAMAKKALQISDLCADAHILLAEEAARDIAAARREYEQGVAAGERALGEDAFEQDVGLFWRIPETRPYMMARAGLARTLWDLGERDEAIAHCKDMLRLNPNDDQRMRYVLASWLLAVGDHGALQTLLASYEKDGYAHWTYTKTLLAFRTVGPSKTTSLALVTAWKANAYVPGMLVGRRKIPRRVSGRHEPGSKDEAILYVLQERENWSATAGALQWLADRTAGLTVPRKRRA
jgi:tetratricopeptide (TPR) repeat protein